MRVDLAWSEMDSEVRGLPRSGASSASAFVGPRKVPSGFFVLHMSDLGKLGLSGSSFHLNHHHKCSAPTLRPSGRDARRS